MARVVSSVLACATTALAKLVPERVDLSHDPTDAGECRPTPIHSAADQPAGSNIMTRLDMPHQEMLIALYER